MNCSTFVANCTTYLPSLTTGNWTGLTNSSTKVNFVKIDLTVAIIFSVFDGFGIVFGTVANLVMILMVWTHFRLRSTTDIFTSSLCISDLLAGVLFQPFVMRRLLARRPNPAYEWALRRFVGQTTLAASSMSLVTATIDRYIALKKPLRHTILVSKRKALFVVALVWLVSLAIGVTAYLRRDLAVFVFPTVIVCIIATIVALQIQIFFIAKTQVKKILAHTSYFERSYRMNYLKEMKATTTIMLLLTVFLISWLPSTIFRFYDRFNGGDIRTFHQWLHVLNTLIQIHCSLDPYLYTFRNQRFRSVIAKYLKRRSANQHSNKTVASTHGSVISVATQTDQIS